MKWRILMGAVALAAAAWSGWWFVGRAAHEAALNGWLAGRRAAGWQAEAAAIATIGFPNRFDTTITDLRLADTRNGWAWSAPFVDIVMLSYRPDQALVALPPEQVLAVPGARTIVRSQKMQGSVRFVPGPALALARVSVEVGELGIDARDWTAAAHALEAHVRRADLAAAPANSYDVFLRADGVRAPELLSGLLAEVGALPPVFDRFTVDATVALDRPLDRGAVEEAPPQIAALSLKAVDARWGDLALIARGTLRADADGYADGTLQVRAENWRAMLRAAVAANALERSVGRAIEAALGVVASLGGDGNVIEAPLVFSGGRMRIGPVPIGRAPRFVTPQRQ